MIVDLQVNVETKDGSLVDPETLVAGAKAAGLDAVLLTRDGQFQPDLDAYREAAEGQDLQIFAGTKVYTNHGLILCILPDSEAELSDSWAEMDGDYFDANSVIDAIEELGGVTVALRPYDRDLPKPMGDHLFSLQGLTGCEVLNGQLTEIANDLALEAASNMEMPCIGTSCADGDEGIGSAATVFRSAASSQEQLCELIRSNDCWPLSFSKDVPQGDEPRRHNNRRNNRGGERRGRDGDRRNNRDGGDRRNNRRGGRRNDRKGGSSDDPQRRRRRPRGPRPDDFGNRVQRNSKNPPPEDIGNRIRNDDEPSLPEDIGNRLAPGEASPYHGGRDDGAGNR